MGLLFFLLSIHNFIFPRANFVFRFGWVGGVASGGGACQNPPPPPPPPNPADKHIPPPPPTHYPRNEPLMSLPPLPSPAGQHMTLVMLHGTPPALHEPPPPLPPPDIRRPYNGLMPQTLLGFGSYAPPVSEGAFEVVADQGSVHRVGPGPRQPHPPATGLCSPLARRTPGPIAGAALCAPVNNRGGSRPSRYDAGCTASSRYLKARCHFSRCQF